METLYVRPLLTYDTKEATILSDILHAGVFSAPTLNAPLPIVVIFYVHPLRTYPTGGEADGWPGEPGASRTTVPQELRFQRPPNRSLHEHFGEPGADYAAIM